MSKIDKILKKAEKEHDLLKHPYVGTEHLLLAILSEENELTDRLKELNLTYNKFKNKLKSIIGLGSKKSPYILYTPMLRKVISTAKEKLFDSDNDVGSVELFYSIIEVNEGIAIRIMEEMNLDLKSFSVLNTNYLKYDANYIIKNRDKEIAEIFQILIRKNKCNPLLIGDAGVGKTAIVEEIQRRLLINDVPSYLKEYKIVNVDMSNLVAGTKYRGDFENKIIELLKRIENKKIIIFIDEIHTLINAGGAEGAISAGDIIKPYLARGLIKCIGATTISEYHEIFAKDEALNRRFQMVMIEEPSNKDTLNILFNIKSNYEKYHKVVIKDELLNEIVEVSNRIINKKNPDKSIELLDSCCTNAKYNEERIVSINNLYNIFKSRFGLIINDNIKSIMNNKSIIMASKDRIKQLNSLDCNVINIDGDYFNDDSDIYYLLGNSLIKNSYYILKKVIDIPIGIISLINLNGNIILKEFVNNLLTKRKIVDNYGNILDFSNYIIVMEKSDRKNEIGFISNKKSIMNTNYIELDEKILLPSL